MPSRPLVGSCGCGAVAFEIAEPLVGAAYCHCTRCRKRTGTAVQASAKVQARIPDRHQRRGVPARLTPPGRLSKTFCSLCGSHLFARDPVSGEILIVRMAAIDGDPGVRPAAHRFVAYAAPWEEISGDGLPRFDERLPEQ